MPEMNLQTYCNPVKPRVPHRIPFAWAKAPLTCSCLIKVSSPSINSHLQKQEDRPSKSSNVAQTLLRGFSKAIMSPRFLIVLVALVTKFFNAEALPKPISNITVIGAVFCDVCSNNTFSKHSYFIKGAKVLIQCKFKANSMSAEEITIMAERITDRFGVYKLDIPPVDGLECGEGREVRSFCRASLIKSSSALCSVPGLRRSTEHVAIKSRDADICFFNLNALNFRPAKMDTSMCRTDEEQMSHALNSSLFFWPSWPLFGLPWPNLPPFPFPFPPITFPSPSSFPFSLPSWLLPFLKPPYFPFPFSSPDSPTFRFPFPPIPFWTPTPSLPSPSPPLPPTTAKVMSSQP